MAYNQQMFTRPHQHLPRKNPRPLAALLLTGLWMLAGGAVVWAALGNDAFERATPILALPYSDTQDTTTATTQSGEGAASCGGAPHNTIWYQFVPTTTAAYRLDTAGSGYDTVLSLWTGATLNSLAEVACNDDAGGLTTSSLALTLTAGITYSIRIGSVGEGGGLSQFHLSIPAPPPANDHLGAALPVPTIPYSDTQDTTAATAEPGEPLDTCADGSSPVANSIWYRFVPPVSAVYHIDTSGSNYDTILSIWTGATLNALTPVACDDESGGASTSRLTLFLRGRTAYAIRVRTVDPGGGSLSRLNVRFPDQTYAAPTQAACGATSPCYLSIQQALNATADAGTVTILGTNTVSTTLISSNGGANSVTLTSAGGTIRWAGGTGALLQANGTGHVTIQGLRLTCTSECNESSAIQVTGSARLTIKGSTISGFPTIFNQSGGVLTAYANNITPTPATAYLGHGTHNIGHNWWGTANGPAPAGLTPGEWGQRLGADVLSWAEGQNSTSLGGANLSGSSGTAVIVNHGRGLSNAPFGNGTLPYEGEICSSYYDFFTMDASGSWTVRVPVDNTTGCTTNVLTSPKLYWILDNSECIPATNAACWDLLLEATPAGQTLVAVGLSVTQLGGTPFVAGSPLITEPNLVTLRHITAISPTAESARVGVLLFLALTLLGWYHHHTK